MRDRPVADNTEATDWEQKLEDAEENVYWQLVGKAERTWGTDGEW